VAELVVLDMTLEDLDEVMAVEEASFRSPWSRQAFVRELTENSFALYLVGKLDGKVVGYGGLWVIINEAHITNIAVHPEFRGRCFGERLLTEMIEGARRRRCDRMTLEVRASNTVAQGLYRKFGFAKQGLRHRYYTDTGEDALIMWKEGL
jgi:ribosomal-protein-alanine N-acetyltransferase